MANKSFSRCFDKDSIDDWRCKLRLVHNRAWSKWKLACSELPELALPTGSVAQEPGEVPWDVINQLKDPIDSLSVSAKKARKMLNAEIPAGKKPKKLSAAVLRGVWLKAFELGMCVCCRSPI